MADVTQENFENGIKALYQLSVFEFIFLYFKINFYFRVAIFQVLNVYHETSNNCKKKFIIRTIQKKEHSITEGKGEISGVGYLDTRHPN